jgi:hypothetical protein
VGGKKGNFVSMPQSKDREGNFHDVAFPLSGDLRKEASIAVLGEFKQLLAERKQEQPERKPSMTDRLAAGRNPNLQVFSSIIHLDETSPHAHINFVPFYTEQKKIGMSKGVSLKSALIEQGFVPQGIKQHQLVLRSG